MSSKKNKKPNTSGNWSGIYSLRVESPSEFSIITCPDASVGTQTITRATDVTVIERSELEQSFIIVNDDKITLELTSQDYSYYHKWPIQIKL